MNVKIFVVSVVLLSVTMVTTGLICQYPPCNLVKCNIVDPDSCNGTVRTGGGYCGCCEACFTEIGLGETCESKDGVDLLFYPPTVLCEKGLYCAYNSSTCEEIPGYSLG